MTRFFFDLHECGCGALIDDEGAQLADLAAARDYAIAAARGIMAEQVASGHLCLGCAIAVRDGSGIAVLAVPFTEALSVRFTNDC